MWFSNSSQITPTHKILGELYYGLTGHVIFLLRAQYKKIDMYGFGVMMLILIFFLLFLQVELCRKVIRLYQDIAVSWIMNKDTW